MTSQPSSRAEERRKRLLAKADARLNRLSPGLNASDDYDTDRSSTTHVHTVEASAPDPPSIMKVEQPAGVDGATAWQNAIKIRRLERGCRFFGTALLAAVLGVPGGQMPVPPVVIFFMYEVFILVMSSVLTGELWSSENSKTQIADDAMDAVLQSLLKTGGSSVEWLNTMLGVAAAAMKVGQDAAWFLFVLLLVNISVEELRVLYHIILY